GWTGVVFFFQAEDGIRDWSVTGVQTCALPISFARRSTWWSKACCAATMRRAARRRERRRSSSPITADVISTRPSPAPMRCRRSPDRKSVGEGKGGGPGGGRRERQQADREDGGG